MGIYKCFECGAEFEYGEMVPILEPFGECHKVCPSCGSGDCYEAEECGGCGNVFFVEDLEEGLCPDCRARVVKELGFLIKEKFTKEEQAFLREVLEI